LVATEVVRRLGVRPLRAVEIDTPSSTDVKVHEYPVRFWFDREFSVEVVALDAPLPVFGLGALVGRDVLDRGQLVYDGPAGEFVLTLGA